MVTARTEDQDAVRGLNTGADDYITKPFNMEALLARMRALLRRSSAVPAKGQLTFHDIAMDLAAHRVRRNGRAGASGADRVPAAGILHAAPAPRVLARGAAGRGVGPGHPRRAAHGRRAHPPAAQVDQRRRANWTWCARCAPRATRWTPSRCDRRHHPRNQVSEGRPGALPLDPTKGRCPLDPRQGQRPLEPFTRLGEREGGPGQGLARPSRRRPMASPSPAPVPPPSHPIQWMDSKGSAFGGGPGGKAPWRVSGRSPDLPSLTRLRGWRWRAARARRARAARGRLRRWRR